MISSMKQEALYSTGALILLILLLQGGIFFLGIFRTEPILSKNEIPRQTALPVPAESNFRQGPNQCGPYAAAIFLRSLEEEITPEDMVIELPWKLPRGYTHPQALESLIEKQGFETTAYNAGALTNEEKIQFLRQTLAKGSPVILLTYMYGYQHYITLLGYDEESFAIYDPVFTRGAEGMTIDENGSLSGNRSIRKEELISHWSQGGIAGFYRWYALATKNAA